MSKDDFSKLTDDEIIAKIQKLSKLVEEHNKAYHDENRFVETDFERFEEKKQLKQLHEEADKRGLKIEENKPEKKGNVGLFGSSFGEDLVENNVGFTPTTRFKRITHKKRMLSLAKTYDLSDLEDFVAKTKRFLGTDTFPDCVCELKIDGLSFSAVYEFGELKYVATRGNGVIGEDVTQNVLQIEGFPKSLPQMKKVERFEVRGEVYMPKDVFNSLNKELEENGEEKFSNPRNAASGTLRQLDTEMVKKRKLGYFAYFLGDCSENLANSQSEALELLLQLGFCVNEHQILTSSLDDILNFHHKIDKIRHELNYDIDGIVIKINSFAIQEQLGITAHDPRWAIAYKFSGVVGITKIVDVIHQVSRSGVITPVAVLDPVNISGIIISRATLHNYEEIERMQLSIGDLVKVKRAGDVIPKIDGIEEKGENTQNIEPPKTCPSCGAQITSKDGFVAVYCPNHFGCKAQIIASIEHFASRKGMEIIGLGGQNITRFYELGFLKNIVDIFNLKQYERQIQLLDRSGEKSTKNLLKSIETSKHAPFNKFLYALGITDLGENVAKIVATHYKNINELLEGANTGFDRLRGIDGFGEVLIENMINYFAEPRNKKMIEELNKILELQEYKTQTGRFSGKSVIFTGTLENLTRQQAKMQAEALGFKVMSAVSKNTDYLVYGADAGSNLKKAQELGVQTLNEGEWNKLIEESLC